MLGFTLSRIADASQRVMNYKIKTLGIVLPQGRRSSAKAETVSTAENTSAAWGVTTAS